MAQIETLGIQCALVTGGAGGLGKAMAQELVRRGKKVIIAGRTEEKCRDTANQLGNIPYYVLDTGKIDKISDFVDTIVAEHPELDCLINNAGVQRPFQILGPDYDFDLTQADEEIDIDIRGPMHLSVLLIQRHFSKLERGAVVMNVSSVLGFVPFSLINPVYNGSKAWLHSFTVNLRTQLAHAESKIKVIEIAPPSVETDLHRERKNPRDNKKGPGSNAISVEEFMDEVTKGWENNDEVIAPGPAKVSVDAWYDTLGKRYEHQIHK